MNLDKNVIERDLYAHCSVIYVERCKIIPNGHFYLPY